MRVIMLGINHRTAAVELRERVALQGERLQAALDRLRALYPHAEAAVLSTCNRTELYLARPTHQPPSGEELLAFLAQTCGVGPTQLRAAAIHREGEQAVLHLFRVCAGLDSMVLGESQVLGQAKRAYELAAARGAVGPALHRVFQQAMAAAKRVRSQTGIDAGRLSVASVAVDFARQIFDRFDDKTVVGVGAGDMAKLTLRHLRALEPAKLWLTNRSPGRAAALAAKLGIADGRGGARPFEDLDELLVEADVVLTSTGSERPIVTADRFRPLLKRRRHRPLFLIDIALPRDVEPAVGSLNNVYLYNLDDLQRVVAQTHAGRTDEVERCEAMLRAAVRETLAEVQNRDIGRLIRELRVRLHELGRAEQARTLRKLTAAAPHEAEGLLEEHTHRLINKILHLPLRQLDRRQDGPSLGFYAAALRTLFDLEGEPAAEPEHAPPGAEDAADDAAPAPSPGPVRAVAAPAGEPSRQGQDSPARGR